MSDSDPDCSLCGGESCRGHGGPLVIVGGKEPQRVCDDCCKIVATAHKVWTNRVSLFVQNKDDKK